MYVRLAKECKKWPFAWL